MRSENRTIWIKGDLNCTLLRERYFFVCVSVDLPVLLAESVVTKICWYTGFDLRLPNLLVPHLNLQNPICGDQAAG